MTLLESVVPCVRRMTCGQKKMEQGATKRRAGGLEAEMH